MNCLQVKPASLLKNDLKIVTRECLFIEFMSPKYFAFLEVFGKGF